MARDKDFSIISLGYEEDEELVIQAGVVAKSEQENEPFEQEQAPFSHQSLQVTPENTTTTPLSSVEKAYREINEDDLRTTGPLPKARLAILIGGLLLLVTFIAYYFLLG